MAKTGQLVSKKCSEKKRPLSHLKDVPAFAVGYSHYPRALMHSPVFKLECTSLFDLHSRFFLQINYEHLHVAFSLLFCIFVFYRNTKANVFIYIIYPYRLRYMRIVFTSKLVCLSGESSLFV